MLASYKTKLEFSCCKSGFAGQRWLVQKAQLLEVTPAGAWVRLTLRSSFLTRQIVHFPLHTLSQGSWWCGGEEGEHCQAEERGEHGTTSWTGSTKSDEAHFCWLFPSPTLYFDPFPFPKFGNDFVIPVPVPKSWECNFPFPFPFPKFGNVIFHSRSHYREWIIMSGIEWEWSLKFDIAMDAQRIYYDKWKLNFQNPETVLV